MYLEYLPSWHLGFLVRAILHLLHKINSYTSYTRITRQTYMYMKQLDVEVSPHANDSPTCNLRARNLRILADLKLVKLYQI